MQIRWVHRGKQGRSGVKLAASLHWFQSGRPLVCWNCLSFPLPIFHICRKGKTHSHTCPARLTLTIVHSGFYSAPQSSHCKRCTSYGNSIRLSVRRSVTRRYNCVKTTARSTVQFALSDSKMCLVLLKPKNIPRGRPLPLKSWFKLTYPLLIAASLDTFCLVARQW